MPKIVVFSGAGLSVESGIPTFRGSGGLWEGQKSVSGRSELGRGDDDLPPTPFTGIQNLKLITPRMNPGAGIKVVELALPTLRRSLTFRNLSLQALNCLSCLHRKAKNSNNCSDGKHKHCHSANSKYNIPRYS